MAAYRALPPSQVTPGAVSPWSLIFQGGMAWWGLADTGPSGPLAGDVGNVFVVPLFAFLFIPLKS